MKITVLVDNNTLIDKYYLGEPALSFLIEDDDRTVLFDTGYSDIYLKNLQKMKIDTSKIDTLVLSHGHNDHTGGLVYIDELKQQIRVYAHPNIFEHKEYEGLTVSSPVQKLGDNFAQLLSKTPVRISKHLTFLGEIPRDHQVVKPLEKDLLLDDSALMYENEDGIAIITGCSHAGIINICEYARKISQKEKITMVIGGFHLLGDPNNSKLAADYFAQFPDIKLYPCHCCDLLSKIILAKKNDVYEIGVSSVIYLPER